MFILTHHAVRERNIFTPAPFTIQKLPGILRTLKADERRVCMLFEFDAIKVVKQ